MSQETKTQMKHGDNARTGQTGQTGGHETLDWTLQPEDHDHFDHYSPDAGDLAIVGVSLVILVVCLLLTARYLFFPGEAEEGHIKRRILSDGGQR